MKSKSLTIHVILMVALSVATYEYVVHFLIQENIMSKEIEEVKETQKEKYLRNMKRAGVVIGLIAGSVIASLR